MTSSSDHEQKNEINIDSKQCTSENQQLPLDKNEIIQETIDQKGQSNALTNEIEDNKVTNGIDNGDALMNTSPLIVTTDEEQPNEANESTVNDDEDENRSRKTSNSKVKYSSMPYHRSTYYVHDQSYGPAPYYYYPPPLPPSISIEKPAPLMFISTQKSSSSSSSTTRENQTSNSTSVSPQNLPPRLRQTSTTENDPNSQVPSNTSSTTQPPPPPPPTTNGRRHRSILPRGSSNYYSPHPPPPLMATPPGVLYTYPPTVHSPGHIAYSIRPSDEFELLALQQQMMNLPPGPILWPPPPAGLSPHGHPLFPPYSMNGPLPPPPSTYIFSNATMAQSANSFLNPDAAEWVPPPNGNDSSSENQILIDDEINFPPLNSATTNSIQISAHTKDSNEDNSEPIDNATEPTSTNTNALNDTTPISTDNSNISSQSNTKTELPTNSSSSQDDTNKPSIKNTPVTYSTIITQTFENNKSNQQRSQQQSTNHVQNQLPPRDRTAKQRPPVASSNSRRRQPLTNNHQRNNTRNPITSEQNSPPKPQPTSNEITDDWIEVKSKKTKKFDRLIPENSSEKLISDEPIPKSLSPPLSLTSTGDNTTTTTFTSEDDFDEKDNQDLVIVVNNDRSNDYNQTIRDDIYRRLNNNEKLFIIMRGCPGSGKSTLAKSINDGYNGVILSSDDYFTDKNLNTYTFDPSRLDDAHRFTRRRASDALKKNISPIIIDNTNTQVWEMKPYVAMGKEAGYEVLLVEPQTPWRHKARELFKRNLHNLPLRRIKDMLNRFEHNITVQNILDQLPSIPVKLTNSISSSEQLNHDKDQEILDPILTPKKCYDIIDDSLILDDVRLCINDMILFLTSNFFQTTRSSQCSTPLSVSFHDLSLISSSTTPSLPSTPSTPHSRFHRPLSRFPSSTNQDHSFNTDIILRLPTTTFTRCIETNTLTPPSSAQSNIIAKKRRKNNKNKEQPNELLLNMNNNNNNNNYMNNQQEVLLPQQTFNVFLPEDCSDFVVIDEENPSDLADTVNQNIGLPMHSLRDHSSIIPCQQKQEINPKTCELINIIHTELTKPSNHPSISTKHISIQCSSDELNSPIDHHSNVVLIGRILPSPTSTQLESIPTHPGYKDCGIQVDLNEHNLDLLMKIYSNRLSSESIQQFYEVCHSDIHWTCSQIDEYLQNNHRIIYHVATLKQLCLEQLNQWNEQIISTNPSFDTNSLDDLLQDINNDEIFEEFSSENSNQINIPLSLVNSLEETYGELPDKSSISSNNNRVLLPMDDDLTKNIYQALERCSAKPVIENTKKKTKKNNQKWIIATDNSDVNTNGVPSLRQIMNEEQQAAMSQKPKQKPQLDYATEHKFKELLHHFPSFDSDLLYDIFHENEYDYDLTFICISTMLDENASAIPMHRTPQSVPVIRSNPTVEPVSESYENLRHDAIRHAQKRKEFYTKAQQAICHGMLGVASFYIQRVSEETRLMQDANRVACERLSQWRLKQYQQTQQLDLHGLHSNEALNLFKQIEQEFNEGNRRTTTKSIEIITGYGKNSVYGGGDGKIRSIILGYLHQRNYKYSEPNKGVILMQLPNARNS